MKNRMIRINEEIQRELSDIIQNKLKDPRINKMVSVLRAEATSDLDICKVYISILGTDDEKKEVMEGIKSASGFIRKELAAGINLRATPQLRFIQDNSIEYAAKISKLIDDVNN